MKPSEQVAKNAEANLFKRKVSIYKQLQDAHDEKHKRIDRIYKEFESEKEKLVNIKEQMLKIDDCTEAAFDEIVEWMIENIGCVAWDIEHFKKNPVHFNDVSEKPLCRCQPMSIKFCEDYFAKWSNSKDEEDECDEDEL